ncbi:MAG: hypothetical protein WCJ95_22225 [Mariniphaga sp.]
MKNKLSDGSTVLNAYHQERSKEACKEVKKMMKHPFSLEQAKAQTERIKEGMRRSGKQAKTMKISDYKRLIQVLPFMEQAFEVKLSQWEKLVSKEILDQIFIKSDDLSQPSITTTTKFKDQTAVISRFELFHKNQNLELFIVKVLMWGYPTKGRGKNIENLLNDSNITNLKNALVKYETNETITISEIKDILKIEGLGLSTLTKFLYFMRLKMGSFRILIFDLRVINALNSGKYSDHGIEHFSSLAYTNALKYYNDYLTFINELAKDLQAEPDQVEMFLFEYGRNLKGMVPMN